VVGIEARLVVDCVPGGKTYQPLSAALLTETLLVVASAALVLLFSTELPVTELAMLRSRSGLG
jgi:hypothetical protein